jgi:hypothetical protein
MELVVMGATLRTDDTAAVVVAIGDVLITDVTGDTGTGLVGVIVEPVSTTVVGAGTGAIGWIDTVGVATDASGVVVTVSGVGEVVSLAKASVNPGHDGLDSTLTKQGSTEYFKLKFIPCISGPYGPAQ